VKGEKIDLACLYCDKVVDPVEGEIHVLIPADGLDVLTKEAVGDVAILLELARAEGWTCTAYCDKHCKEANLMELDGMIRFGMMPVSDTEN